MNVPYVEHVAKLLQWITLGMDKLQELCFLRDTMQELIADPEIDFGPAYEMTVQRKKRALSMLQRMIREERLFSHGGEDTSK